MTAKQVRSKTLDYMGRNQDTFLEAVPLRKRHKYLSKMRKCGEWGDEPELRAASAALKFNFILCKLSENGLAGVAVVSKKHPGESTPLVGLLLEERAGGEGNHYSPIARCSVIVS